MGHGGIAATTGTAQESRRLPTKREGRPSAHTGHICPHLRHMRPCIPLAAGGTPSLPCRLRLATRRKRALHARGRCPGHRRRRSPGAGHSVRAAAVGSFPGGSVLSLCMQQLLHNVSQQLLQQLPGAESTTPASAAAVPSSRAPVEHARGVRLEQAYQRQQLLAAGGAGCHPTGQQQHQQSPGRCCRLPLFRAACGAARCHACPRVAAPQAAQQQALPAAGCSRQHVQVGMPRPARQAGGLTQQAQHAQHRRTLPCRAALRSCELQQRGGCPRVGHPHKGGCRSRVFLLCAVAAGHCILSSCWWSRWGERVYLQGWQACPATPCVGVTYSLLCQHTEPRCHAPGRSTVLQPEAWWRVRHARVATCRRASTQLRLQLRRWQSPASRAPHRTASPAARCEWQR